MKKFFFNSILFSIILFSGFYAWQTFEPCRKPLFYDIGTINAQHGMSYDKFKNLLEQGETVWEKATEKNLFEYKAGARLKINLVFDEKQAELSRIKDAEMRLDVEKKALDARRTLVENLQTTYDQKSAEFENLLNAWNESPRTSQSEFHRLKDTETALARLGTELQNEVSSYNTLIQSYNASVQTFNHHAEFEEEAGVARGGRSIDIFVLEHNETDRFLVAHELGHALGIEGHSDDPNALMFYKLPKNIETISESDRTLLARLCRT